MNYSGYELLYLFLVYSFLGWVLETVFAALKQKRFVNRGLINGPFCIIYGIAAVVITVGLKGLQGIWLFLATLILTGAIEWIAGHLIERIYHERWWDYSGVKWNIDGYVCLPVAAFWGVLGFVTSTWSNSLLLNLYKMCPAMLIHIVLWSLLAVLIVDILASYLLVTGESGKLDKWEAANNRIANVSARLGRWIYVRVERRIRKAYPKAQPAEKIVRDKTKFAQGCGFYKVVLLFFVGAFIGDITETIFCRITAGVWMSRSSVVWGPFSIVWGLAIAVATAMLYRYRDRTDGFLFLIGTFLGGVYEYLCSVFTEIVFGKIFWDYSGMPFNLGGRVNLLFCFFWGIAAVVWFKKLYPVVSKLIEKLPRLPGIAFTWILIVFMCANIVVTSMALIRYDERGKGAQAVTSWQEWTDEYYPDDVMERIYPNAKQKSGT
jgi:uncharacterized membrane protein